MTCKVSGTSISITKGDTAKIEVSLKQYDGKEYKPADGDVLTFAVKKTYDRDILIRKEIPPDTRALVLEPMDTKCLEVGKYIYDMELKTSSGEVDTFINCATFQILPEVAE